MSVAVCWMAAVRPSSRGGRATKDSATREAECTTQPTTGRADRAAPANPTNNKGGSAGDAGAHSTKTHTAEGALVTTIATATVATAAPPANDRPAAADAPASTVVEAETARAIGEQFERLGVSEVGVVEKIAEYAAQADEPFDFHFKSGSASALGAVSLWIFPPNAKKGKHGETIRHAVLQHVPVGASVATRHFGVHKSPYSGGVKNEFEAGQRPFYLEWKNVVADVDPAAPPGATYEEMGGAPIKKNKPISVESKDERRARLRAKALDSNAGLLRPPPDPSKRGGAADLNSSAHCVLLLVTGDPGQDSAAPDVAGGLRLTSSRFRAYFPDTHAGVLERVDSSGKDSAELIIQSP